MMSEKVLELMMTKTISMDWKMLSKLIVPPSGFSPWRQMDPAGHVNPLARKLPFLKFIGDKSSKSMLKTQGTLFPSASTAPPQKCSSLTNAAVRFVGSVGSSHTQVRLRLDLKLWTPIMPNKSQKKMMRKEMRTRRGAAFLRLLRII
jgi:hypothetical protein